MKKQTIFITGIVLGVLLSILFIHSVITVLLLTGLTTTIYFIWKILIKSFGN